jgi:fermentation-respiration switch protein FrsA (DUF1100 family)
MSPASRTRAWLLSLLRIGAAAFVLAMIALWAGVRWLERNKLYYPSREISVIPRTLGMPFEDVSLVTADRMRLHGWFIPAPLQGPLASEGLAILLCHGNAGNISNRVQKAALLHQLGLSVLLFDYRGFGKSEGTPSEPGTYLDADAAYAYLTQTRKIPAERIVIHGESIGNGVAIEAALRHPSRALIVESAFTSIAGMGKSVVPWLPLQWFVTWRYDNLAKLPKVGRPILVMHSRDDEVIPFAMGQALFAAACEPKRFLELKGSHNDGFAESGAAYPEAILSFLKTD